MDMSDPPAHRPARLVRRLGLWLAVAAGICIFSFMALVVRGHYDAGFDGWEFNYLGKRAWESPRTEKFLASAYLPLHVLSNAVGIRIVHLSQPLRGIDTSE